MDSSNRPSLDSKLQISGKKKDSKIYQENSSNKQVGEAQ